MPVAPVRSGSLTHGRSAFDRHLIRCAGDNQPPSPPVAIQHLPTGLLTVAQAHSVNGRTSR
jgi:hypothetical protein